MVLVLDFGFGECGLVMHAPVDRPQALVDESVLVKREERGQHHGLILRSHRGVWAIKAAEHTNALELSALQIQVFLGVFAAGGTNGCGRHLQLLPAQFLVDLDLDGEPMAVPSGDVGGIESHHRL